MKHVGFLLAAAAVLAAILAFATSRGGARTAQAAPDAGTNAAKALFEKKCSSCHDLDRALDKTKDRAGWTETVGRMRKVNGAPVTDEEADAIVGHLVKVRGAKGP